MPARSHAPHLLALLAALLLVQAPRLGGRAADAVAPVIAPDSGYLDFDHGYYPAGQAIWRNPAALYRGVAYDHAVGTLTVTAPASFVNVPIVAWAFVPFTALGLPHARTVFLGLNVAVALSCLFLVQRRLAAWRPAARWLATVAFVTSGPLMNAMNLGATRCWRASRPTPPRAPRP
jgi:hypothetical protein